MQFLPLFLAQKSLFILFLHSIFKKLQQTLSFVLTLITFSYLKNNPHYNNQGWFGTFGSCSDGCLEFLYGFSQNLYLNIILHVLFLVPPIPILLFSPQWMAQCDSSWPGSLSCPPTCFLWILEFFIHSLDIFPLASSFWFTIFFSVLLILFLDTTNSIYTSPNDKSTYLYLNTFLCLSHPPPLPFSLPPPLLPLFSIKYSEKIKLDIYFAFWCFFILCSVFSNLF